MSHPAPNTINRKEKLWLILTIIGLLAVYLSPLREYLTHVQDLKDDLQALGGAGPILFMAGLAAMTAIGVPRLLLFPLGGLVFGLWPGLLWCLTGALIGSYAAFLFARFAGRGVIAKKWPAALRLATALEGRSFITVALLRQLPAPGHLTNIFLGLSPVRHTAFLLGTLLGALPSAVPAVMIGTSISHPNHDHRIMLLGLACGLLALVWMVGSYQVRKHLN